MFKQQKWYWGPKTLCFVLPKPLTIDSIGYCVKSGQVQYFNIDKGLDSGDKKVQEKRLKSIDFRRFSALSRNFLVEISGIEPLTS